MRTPVPSAAVEGCTQGRVLAHGVIGIAAERDGMVWGSGVCHGDDFVMNARASGRLM